MQEVEPVVKKTGGLRRLRAAIVGSAARVFKAARSVVSSANRR